MKFYSREKELQLLKKTSRATVLGSRRIGKTRLLEEAMLGECIYLFFSMTHPNRLLWKMVERVTVEKRLCS